MHASGPLCCKWHVLCLVFDACSHVCCKCNFNIQLELIFHHVHIYIDIYTYMSMKEITWARHSEMCSQTFRSVERLIGRRAIRYETFVAKNMSPISHNPNKWIFNEDMNLWTFGIIIIQFMSCQHRKMQMASLTNQFIRFPYISKPKSPHTRHCTNAGQALAPTQAKIIVYV